MNTFLVTLHGLSLIVYGIVLWRYWRIYRSEARLLDELQVEGTVPGRGRPVVFAVLYGLATVGIALATSLLIALRPHWL